MPFDAEISRTNPTSFLFMIDQSESMSGPFGGQQGGKRKADVVADTINRLLANLVMKCAKAEGVRNYFQIGVIGYGSQVTSALRGTLTSQFLYPISEIADHPLRVEERIKRESDGAGGILEQAIKFPVWIDPVADNGTPMREAFQLTTNLLNHFVQTFPASYPPIVLNLTDGEANDDPMPAAQQLTSLRTDNGNVLLFNLHISSHPASPIEFPCEDRGLPDPYANLLFHMSSTLPPNIQDTARKEGYPVNRTTRGFVFNADAVSLVRFLNIGTQRDLR